MKVKIVDSLDDLVLTCDINIAHFEKLASDNTIFNSPIVDSKGNVVGYEHCMQHVDLVKYINAVAI